MLSRVLPLFLLVLGLTAFTVRAEEKKADGDKHEGKIVKINGNKLTMTDKEGKNEHTHTITAEAKVMCDSKECKLADLKPGEKVCVTTKKGDPTTVVKVEVTTKKEEKKDK